MHTIHIHSDAYQVPSRWDELSAYQLRMVAWLATLPRQGSKISKLFFYVLISDLPFWKRLRLQFFYLAQATTDERGDFLLLPESFHQFRQFTTQRFPIIRIKSQYIGGYSVLLTGPTSGLANCTFFEFIQAEQFFLSHLFHQANPSKVSSSKLLGEYLDLLIATLYRPIRSDYDPNQHEDGRYPLTESGTKARLKLIANLDHKTKLAILMWFDGCRQFLVGKFPLLFAKPSSQEHTTTKSISESLSPTKKQGPPQSQAQWVKLISELAGSMSQYKEIGDTNLVIAFMDISHRIQKNNQAKKEAATRSKRK